MKTKYLLTPGPVGLPDAVQAAGSRPLISHRCDAFSELLAGIEAKLSTLLDSEAPVIILPSSGTGALEALAVNFLGADSSFISVSCGTFGDRFREIALRTKATGHFLDIPQGNGVSPELVAEFTSRHGGCDALLLTHNETSTGVVNPLKEIIAALPGDKKPLVLVDGVSSVGAVECRPREWGVDGIATASQKGLMTPPGLGLVWLSGRAWDVLRSRDCPSYNFDLKLHRKDLIGEHPANPYTPPVSLYYALDAALDIILENGADAWFAARARYAKAFSAGLEAMGLENLVKDEKYRSPGVTAIKPGNLGAEEIRKNLRLMGIEAAGGQGKMSGQLLRIAHYNDCGWPELAMILGSLYAACGLAETGAPDFLRRAWQTWNDPTSVG